MFVMYVLSTHSFALRLCYCFDVQNANVTKIPYFNKIYHTTSYNFTILEANSCASFAHILRRSGGRRVGCY